MPNENRGEPRALALIDRALDCAKDSAHACRNDAARLHHEFALALLRESWIAESGQAARTAAEVIEDVRKGLRLIERIVENRPAASLPVVELEED